MLNNCFTDEKLKEEFGGLRSALDELMDKYEDVCDEMSDDLQDIADRVEFIHDGLGLDEMEKEQIPDEELLIPEQELYTFNEALEYAKDCGKKFQCLAWDGWKDAKRIKEHCSLVWDEKEGYGVSTIANYGKFRTWFTPDEEAGLWVEKQWPQ